MRPCVTLALLAALIAAAPVTPPEHRRPPDQTYLTIPEWFLVFSPEEYARYLATRPPSHFPFFGHLAQFWEGYGAAASASAPFPANAGYHVMIMVIGVSTSVEYGLKGFYERLVGRFAEQVAGGSDTPEDRLAAGVARDYVAFIKVHPWYEFDFVSPLRAVWTETGLFGPHMLRKWERKYLLTSEYLAKACYGWVLGKATRSSYARPIEQTYVIVRSPAGSPTQARLPRYQAFTTAAIALAQRGNDFVEIAGNRSEIVLTLVGSPLLKPPAPARSMFAQPMLTGDGQVRHAWACPVADLARLLRWLQARDQTVEHIYDF